MNKTKHTVFNDDTVYVLQLDNDVVIEISGKNIYSIISDYYEASLLDD